MKVLIVCPQPFFSFRGTPFSVYYRTRVTGELGIESAMLTYGQGADVELPGCRVYRVPAFRWLGRVKIGPSPLKLWLDCWMALWTVALLCRHRYAVVHAHEEAVFWCVWLKPLFRFRLIYDMHSSLPQQLANFRFTRSRLLHWMFERLERRAVRSADAVIVVCPSLEDHARTLTDEHDKIVLIENSISDPVELKANGADAISRAVSARDASPEAGLKDWLDDPAAGPMVVYAGTLEPYQGIANLLTAFTHVTAALPRARLLIVGGSSAHVETYTRQSEVLGLGSNVRFTGQVDQAEARRLVRLGAVSVSPRVTGTNTPLKIYHLMADGVPLVATRIESHVQVLEDETCTLTDPEPRALAEGLLWALNNPEGAREKAARASTWYEEHYSRQVYTRKMKTLMDRVLA
jgi:glycosyltransferase involved in cell wall biosynthesis